MGDLEVETTGACRYCGQLQILHTADYIDNDTADNMATAKCDCMEATEERRRQKKKAVARAKINHLFADSKNGRTVPEESLELLYMAADLVVDAVAADVKVNYGQGLKCIIKQGSKNITVEKKEEKQTKESV